jgi:hypothetical protein
VEALWPKVLPALALNRALIMPEKKGEVLNGWKVGRYRYFLYCFGGMFLYFWIPNTLFTALRVSIVLEIELMVAHELDDLDCPEQLCVSQYYWKLWRHGIQPHLDSRLEYRWLRYAPLSSQAIHTD